MPTPNQCQVFTNWEGGTEKGNTRKIIKSGGELVKTEKMWCEGWKRACWGMAWGTLSAQGTGARCLVCWALLRDRGGGRIAHVTPSPSCWDPFCHISSSFGRVGPVWPGPGGHFWREVLRFGGRCLLGGLIKVKKLHLSWGFSEQERIVCCSSMLSKVTALYRNGSYGFPL